MTIRNIGPHEAARRMAGGAVLMDIREVDEYARDHIRGGLHLRPWQRRISPSIAAAAP